MAFIDAEFDNAVIHPRVRRRYTGITAVLGGPANVVMQLSIPPVGYGVEESVVDSGSLKKHPIKRARTTVTYLAVALLGTGEERAAYRKAVNESHRRVRSGPNSPVKYNAFDPQLQLWVAACIYVGFRDTHDALYGKWDDEGADALYRDASRIATTLQVRPEMWPADRAAFEKYWESKLPEVHIDDTIRASLQDVIDYASFPWFIRVIARGPSRFFNTGFLPPLWREQMQLEWTEKQQRRFERTVRAIGKATAVLPDSLRMFPFNAYLWDMRRRIRKGTSLV